MIFLLNCWAREQSVRVTMLFLAALFASSASAVTATQVSFEYSGFFESGTLANTEFVLLISYDTDRLPDRVEGNVRYDLAGNDPLWLARIVLLGNGNSKDYINSLVFHSDADLFRFGMSGDGFGFADASGRTLSATALPTADELDAFPVKYVKYRSDDGRVTGNFGSLVSVPEPSTWATMVTGFGLTSFMLRRRQVTISRV